MNQRLSSQATDQRRPQRPRSPRTYGMPSEAGAPRRLRRASREPMTSTTMTIAYGSMFRKKVDGWYVKNGLGMPKKSGGPWMSSVRRRIVADEVGAEERPDRAPLGEDHQADGDPALARRGLLAEPAG